MNLLAGMPPVYVVTSAVISFLVAVLSVVFIIFKQPVKTSPTQAGQGAGGTDSDDVKPSSLKGSRGVGDGEIDAPQHSDADNDGTNCERERLSDRDPVAYCEHIQSEVKKTHQRLAQQRLEEGMTPQQHDDEKDVQKKQLEAIYKLMGGPNGDFGISTIDDIHQQMKFYK